MTLTALPVMGRHALRESQTSGCGCLQDDPDRDYGKKDRRREEERKRKAARSGFVRDLVQEIEGAPEEVSRLCHI